MPIADAVELLDDILDQAENLTQWEQGFIDNVSPTVRKGDPLTESQFEKLEEIWNRLEREDD
jgi:hypothetical protein